MVLSYILVGCPSLRADDNWTLISLRADDD